MPINIEIYANTNGVAIYVAEVLKEELYIIDNCLQHF